MTAPVPKPWITAIPPYVPGRDHRRRPQAGQALGQREPARHQPDGARGVRARGGRCPSRYPDPGSDRAARGARRAARDRSRRGSSAAPARTSCSHLAASAFAGPGDEVLYVRYGFSVYEIAARRCRRDAGRVAPDADYGTDVDALLACVTERTRVVFLANPNNPTGTFLPRAELARLHAGAARRRAAGARPGLCRISSTPEDDDGGLGAGAHAHANVLVTRTFSKIYGLAGERDRLGLRRARADRGAEPHPRAVQRHATPAQAAASPRSATRPSSRARASTSRAERAWFVAASRSARQSRPARGAERGQLRARAVRGRADRRGRATTG